MHKKLAFVIFLVAIVILGAVLYRSFYGTQTGSKEQSTAKVYCSSDVDCVCGVDRQTKECSFGNKKYIDASQQCPDFCTGIDGNLTITCVSNTCIQH